MCRPVTCKTCGKTTWAGCGNHIDAVRKSVPASQWCDGKHADSADASAGSAPKQGFLQRILGR